MDNLINKSFCSECNKQLFINITGRKCGECSKCCKCKITCLTHYLYTSNCELTNKPLCCCNCINCDTIIGVYCYVCFSQAIFCKYCNLILCSCKKFLNCSTKCDHYEYKNDLQCYQRPDDMNDIDYYNMYLVCPNELARNMLNNPTKIWSCNIQGTDLKPAKR